MAGLLGGATSGSGYGTTKAEEDVDAGTLGGCCRWVRQWPLLKLKKTSTMDPLGVPLIGPTAATIEAEEDVDGGPLGVLPVGLAAAITKAEEDIDGMPLGGVAGSGHH
jgi:hypothetical protein